MTNEVVERVARAIRQKREMSLCALCDRPGTLIRCSCEEMARAAIEAFRSPTGPMLVAALMAFGETARVPMPGSEEPFSRGMEIGRGMMDGRQVEAIWRAMIDAALEEDEKK